jgi:hypothetical protein
MESQINTIIDRLNKLKKFVEDKIKELEEPEEEEENDYNMKPDFNYSYNKDYVKNIKDIYSVRHRRGTTSAYYGRISDNIKELYSTIFQGQQGFDLIPTPFNDAQKMLDDVFKYKNYYNGTEINILEPSVGIGNILTTIIDNKKKFIDGNIYVNNIDAIEYNKALYPLIKKEYNISNFYNADFLEFKSDKFYDLIFMNPPYGCSIYINNKEYSTKECHLIHLVKAMIINNNYNKNPNWRTTKEFTIYIICPELGKLGQYTRDKNYLNDYIGDFNSLINNKTIKRNMAKFFGLDYSDDDGIDLPSNQIFYMGMINDFIKLNKDGKATDMMNKFYMYKIVCVI